MLMGGKCKGGEIGEEERRRVWAQKCII